MCMSVCVCVCMYVYVCIHVQTRLLRSHIIYQFVKYFIQMLQKCWENDPGKRPKFKEMEKHLTKLGAKLQDFSSRDIGIDLSKRQCGNVCLSVS